MSHEIPVVDDSGIEVCRVIWDGTLYEGSAKVISIAGNELEAQQLSDMIRGRGDLTELYFRSEGERSRVKGWKGYEGVVGALRIVLPSMGYSIGHLGGDMPPLGRKRVEEVVFNLDENGIE